MVNLGKYTKYTIDLSGKFRVFKAVFRFDGSAPSILAPALDLRINFQWNEAPTELRGLLAWFVEATKTTPGVQPATFGLEKQLQQLQTTQKTSKSSRPLLLGRKWNGTKIYCRKLNEHFWRIWMESFERFNYLRLLFPQHVQSIRVVVICCDAGCILLFLEVITCKYGLIQGNM